MGTLKAGMAKVVVTPPVGTQLAGYAGRTDPSTGVTDDLYAKALVLDDGNVQFTVNDGQVNVNSKIKGPTTRVTTAGQVRLDGHLNIRSQLAL